MNTPTYNQRVFFIEDEDERDQCQFVYVPQDGEPPKRCQKDGIYRIGLTIFLCGWHMPGVGRHPETKPVKLSQVRAEPSLQPAQEDEARQISEKSIHGRLLVLFIANTGQILTYETISENFPGLSTRQNIQTVVSQLRKWTGSHIVNVAHQGYKYISSGKE